MTDAVSGPRPGRLELHTHLEGSLTPRRLIELADRYGQPGLPAACLTPDGGAFAFDGFGGFLELFRDITSVLRTPADFHALALDLGRQLVADDVIYAEVTVSYGVLQKRGIDPLPVQRALAEAAAEIETEQGIALRWLPDAVRQWGVDAAWRAWEKAATAGRDLGVVGFGLGGDEAAGPAADFARLFREVGNEGFGVTIHAGEVPGMGAAAGESVRRAVEDCGAQRIGHGLAAAQDPQLLALLAAREILVEACPGSNVMTGAVADRDAYPLRSFLDAGVPVCLNTDDRTLFGLDLNQEYIEAAARYDLTDAETSAMSEAAIRAAFATDVTF